MNKLIRIFEQRSSLQMNNCLSIYGYVWLRKIMTRSDIVYKRNTFKFGKL